MAHMSSHEILQAFQEYLIVDGKGGKTVVSYTGDIARFLTWLETKQIEFTGELTRFFIISYKEYLVGKNYSVNTINKKINSLHSFNQFLIAQNLCKELLVYPSKDKIKVASGSEQEVEVFTDEEVERLLFYLENRNNVSQRDRAAIVLLLYTGLRVSELVNLKTKDIDFLTMYLKVVGKGGKYREVPLKTEVIEAIKDYLEGERKNHKLVDSQYLLLTQRAEKMDKDTINKLLKKHGKQLHLEMYPHKFRHTFCTRLIKKGVEITTVAKLAGHANIQTTSDYYINTSREEKQHAVNLL
ncbi:integrase/recombinase XerD [Desulfonispora thiosulfatigenes DSM 11270]|uniref:Integrase/recombinase XerD n=1 Tax=Desulfonispora thiosulfatigenes DSM 11270 TaxID=656914 RepID=A0A1W1UNS9_DESTI|nr:integrase/recombinase XerD [Desulfonispora thiosulfatigenes DSM 11270]